jgi:hypothetical protein
MQSRLMWLRMLSPSDHETYRRWARAVAVSYVTITVCGMALAVIPARHQGDQDHVVALRASTKAH